MSDDAERLSPDDLAFWQALLAEAEGARRALDVAARGRDNRDPCGG